MNELPPFGTHCLPKGGINMSENKDTQKEKKNEEANLHTTPGNIKGKLDVPDTRERKDGPGGN